MSRDADRPAVPRRARGLAGGHVLFSGVFVVLVAASPAAQFTKHLPQGVPDLAGFSKASGSAELDNGGSLEYELYYRPDRANYEIIRYRVTGVADGGDGRPYSPNERLQWQAQVKELRRYECEPAAGDCRWRELPRDGEDYRREVGVVLKVLDLHRRLLFEREGGSPR